MWLIVSCIFSKQNFNESKIFGGAPYKMNAMRKLLSLQMKEKQILQNKFLQTVVHTH